MAHSQIPHAAGRGRGDRISKLDDGVLGHILSFLPAKEAARAAALSTRWRDVFASVHTVSLEQPQQPEQPERPVPRGSERFYRPSYGPLVVRAPPFADGVSAALLARHRRRGAGAPLRALRVAFGNYAYGPNDHGSMVDQWISYAMQQCGPELRLDLRLCDGKICGRGYSLRGSAASGKDSDFEEDERRSASSSDDDSGEDEASRHTLPSTTNDETPPPKRPSQKKDKLYAAPRGVFSCAALRALCLGPCKLDPPAGAGATSLPSLETLLLTRVADSARKVQRLISGCPRLADLTLEACARVTALSVLDNKRLRRLALRCCHRLASVAVDASGLRAFEYRGAVPTRQPPFLTIHNGPPRSMSLCMVDLCGKELTSEEDLVGLREFLRFFASAERLHLTSARLGSGVEHDAFSRLPAFSTLRHLELTGSLPHDGGDSNGTATVAAVTRILEHAPNLEVLTLFFKAPPRDTSKSRYHVYSEEELLDAHNLRYDRGAVFVPPATATVSPCLRNRVREINLVHYQGGDAQRTLARFLLGGVACLDTLYCGLAEGPLWIQTKLMDEIRGWARDKIEPDEMMFL